MLGYGPAACAAYRIQVLCLSFSSYANKSISINNSLQSNGTFGATLPAECILQPPLRILVGVVGFRVCRSQGLGFRVCSGFRV